MYYINEFNFSPNKKYLIYYRGNFGPPTRGHWSLIEMYSNLDNVKYFIHQIGERHGIPYEVNRKILKIYLNYLRSSVSKADLSYVQPTVNKTDSEKIVLRKMDSSLEVLDYIEDVDEVIYIRGTDSVTPLNKHEAYQMYKDMKERYYPLYKKLRSKGISMHFLFVDRPKMERLSATKFTESLKKYKRGLINIKELKYYVPKNLSKDDFEYVVNKLKRYV